MAKAKQLPSGNWRVQVFSHVQDGKKVYKSFTAPTKKDAEKMASLFVATEKDKEHHSVNPFCKCSAALLESRENVYSPSTYRNYITINNALNRDFADFINMDVYGIAQTDVQVVINDLARTRSPKTVRNIYCFIMDVIKMYRYDVHFHVVLPQKKKYEPYIPTDAEVKKLLEVSKGSEIEIPIMLACFGMMREGEICALTLEDIKDNVVTINKSRVRGVKEYKDKVPKTYTSNRKVVIPQFLADMIREKGHVTTYRPTSINKALQSAIKKAELHPFRFHDLRHYGTSVLLAEGCDRSFVQKRGGWATPYVMDNVYRHMMRDREQDENKKALDFFDKFV